MESWKVSTTLILYPFSRARSMLQLLSRLELSRLNAHECFEKAEAIGIEAQVLKKNRIRDGIPVVGDGEREKKRAHSFLSVTTLTMFGSVISPCP
jgi:hypothetical protein